MIDRAAAAPWKVFVAFAAVYLIWGSTYLAIAVAIETLPPFIMAGVRFLIAGSVLYVWARLAGAGRPSAGEWQRTVALGALFLLGGNGGVVWAEQRVPSGLTALLVAVVPVWTVLIDWARPGGARPNAGVVIGAGVGLLGVALLVAPGSISGGAAIDPVGAVVLLFASLSWAIAGVMSGKMQLPKSPLLSSAMQMLGGGALLFLVSVIAGEPARVDPGAVSTRSLGAVLYLIVFGSLVGFTAFAWLLRVTTPARVATYAYVNPAVAVVLGWAVAGEPLTLRSLVAAAIIIGGVVLITTSRSRPMPKEPAAAPKPAGGPVEKAA